MKRAAKRTFASLLLIAPLVVIACSGGPGGGHDGKDGGADAADDVALDQGTGSDATLDAGDDGASDAGADATLDAGDDAAADAGDDAASDAGDDDASSFDAGDASVDASDGGATTRFVITSCTTQEGAGGWRSTWIDSEGNRYTHNLVAAPPAGSAFPAPAPPGWPAPYAKLSPAELADLVVAAQTLDTSTAGHTVTIGQIYHFMTYTGYLRSAGRLKNPAVLVDSLTDGVSYGQETIILHNDPAAVIVRINRCFSVTH